MKDVKISDITMKQGSLSLSFKEKIELAKLLDRLGVDIIELEAITQPKIDTLLIKSIATAVQTGTVAVPVQLNTESVTRTYQALKEAKRPRLQVCAAVSTVQMEYLFHKKPDAMLQAIAETVAACRKVCEDVEFIADDATRSDIPFLCSALSTAIEAGASTVTICDAAGSMLPDEFILFLSELQEKLPTLANVCLAVRCNNTLSMADACTIAALRCGIGEVKTAACTTNAARLENIVKVISEKSDVLKLRTCVRTAQLTRISKQIDRLCAANKHALFNQIVHEDDDGIYLTAHDDIHAVTQSVAQLGYDLSDEDIAVVFEAFSRIAAKKEKVSKKELDAIVAAAAMQVPPTYTLDHYVITAGNTISATAHMKLTKHGRTLEGISIGDGPIDAAFLAIEQIIGRHYELDDFQIQSVTEGREAMGQTVIKLRSEGKLYSGHGISTDIVGASIRAYLNALNKIVYEEAEA